MSSRAGVKFSFGAAAVVLRCARKSAEEILDILASFGSGDSPGVLSPLLCLSRSILAQSPGTPTLIPDVCAVASARSSFPDSKFGTFTLESCTILVLDRNAVALAALLAGLSDSSMTMI